MSELERALSAPPPADATLLADVERRLAAPPRRPARGIVVAASVVASVVVLAVVVVVVFFGAGGAGAPGGVGGRWSGLRVAPLSSAPARLALLAVDDRGASRPLLDGDSLQAGEGVVPGVVVVRPEPGRLLLVAAREEESGVVTWLSPREGCPVAGGAPEVAVPRGGGAFSVLLVAVEGCDDDRKAQIAQLLTQRNDGAAGVIDVVGLAGVR